jgi:hypothetical protein
MRIVLWIPSDVSSSEDVAAGLNVGDYEIDITEHWQLFYPKELKLCYEDDDVWA